MKIFSEKTKLKLSKIDENGLTVYENIARARTEKQRAEGKIIDLDSLPDFQCYLFKVRRLSEFNYKKNKDLINPLNLKRSKKEFHLDHMVSIKDGFLNNIPIYIISAKKNLEMLDSYSNLSKNSKSSIKLEDLLKRLKFS